MSKCERERKREEEKRGEERNKYSFCFPIGEKIRHAEYFN